jgi:hypothetical protein
MTREVVESWYAGYLNIISWMAKAPYPEAFLLLCAYCHNIHAFSPAQHRRIVIIANGTAHSDKSVCQEYPDKATSEPPTEDTPPPKRSDIFKAVSENDDFSSAQKHELSD